MKGEKLEGGKGVMGRRGRARERGKGGSRRKFEERERRRGWKGGRDGTRGTGGKGFKCKKGKAGKERSSRSDEFVLSRGLESLSVRAQRERNKGTLPGVRGGRSEGNPCVPWACEKSREQGPGSGRAEGAGLTFELAGRAEGS